MNKIDLKKRNKQRKKELFGLYNKQCRILQKALYLAKKSPDSKKVENKSIDLYLDAVTQGSIDLLKLGDDWLDELREMVKVCEKNKIRGALNYKKVTKLKTKTHKTLLAKVSRDIKYFGNRIDKVGEPDTIVDFAKMNLISAEYRVQMTDNKELVVDFITDLYDSMQKLSDEINKLETLKK